MFPNLLIYGFLLLFLLKQKKTREELFLWTWLSVPIIVAFLISLIQPIYQSIYFIICLVPFMLLVSYSLSLIRKQWIVITIASVLFTLSSVRAGAWYLENQSIKGIINNENENYRAAARDVLMNKSKDDITIFYGYFARTPFEVYGVNNIVEIASGPYAAGGGSALPNPNVPLIKSFHYPHVWLILVQSEGTGVTKANEQISQIQKALTPRYSLAKVDNYYVVSVLKYSLKTEKKDYAIQQ